MVFVLFVLLLLVLLLVVVSLVCCLETTKTPQRHTMWLLLFERFVSRLFFFVCFVVLVFLSWGVCLGLFPLLLDCCFVCCALCCGVCVVVFVLLVLLLVVWLLLVVVGMVCCIEATKTPPQHTMIVFC